MDLLIALLMFVTIWGGLTALLAWGIGKLARRWSKRRRYTVATIVAVVMLGAALSSMVVVMDRPASIATSRPVPTQARPPSDVPPDTLVHGPSSNNNLGAGSNANQKTPQTLPTFPWPPPAPSASIVIPNAVVLRAWEHPELLHEAPSMWMHLYQNGVAAPRLAHVNAALRWSLGRGGYWEASYYAVPGGFALVARLERIKEDGTSYPDAERWNATYKPMSEFSVKNYLRALFIAPPGYYRVIAFIVSAQPFSASDKRVSPDEANLWLQRGGNVLPEDLADQAFRSEHACTALIYEFEKRDVSSDPFGRRPGRLAADTHIIKSKIGEALRWQFQ